MKQERTTKLTDWQDDALIKRAWILLRALALQAAAMIAALPADRVGARAVHRFLRIGEAMARRLLVMTVLERGLKKGLGRAALRPVSPLSAEARAALKALQRDRRQHAPPRFALAEPLSLRSATGPKGPHYTSIDKGPRIRVLWGDPYAVTRALVAPPPAPPPAPAARPACDHLARRLAALQDVIDRPDRHARRLARWIALQSVRPRGRSTPMRPGRAPGQVKDRRRRSPEQACLADLDWSARRLRTLASATGPPPD